MSENILPLKTRPQIARDSVVEMLEGYLEQAKAGELVAVAMAYARPNHAVGTDWSEGAYAGELMGAVHLLSHRLTDSVAYDDPE